MKKTMTTNKPCAFQHDQKKKRTLTEFSSLKAINAEIEECGHNLSVFFIFGKT